MIKLQLILLSQTGLIFLANSRLASGQEQGGCFELTDTDNEPLTYPDPFYEPSPEDIMMNFREASRYH